MITEDRKQEILYQVNKALEIQFSIYSWDNMLDDALTDFTQEEKNWASNHTSYKAYICE